MPGKGFDYYRNNYNHEQLWEMLVTQGDSWSVEQSGSVWTSAKSGLSAAREQLDTSMLATVDYWQGPASEEFQKRMRLVYEFSENSEEDMRAMSETWIPDVAQALTDAQGKAKDQDLDPGSELEYEDWLEDVKNVKPEDPDYIEKQEQYRNEYQTYQKDRHDALAQIIADLGDFYKSERVYGPVDSPPPPPPSDMPGNTTFQPPTGGVFGNDGLNAGGAGPAAGPGASPESEIDGTQQAGLIGGDADLDPVDGWAPGSYGDVDSDIGGGLAGGTSGGMHVGGGGYGGGTATPAAGGIGGGSVAGAGSGLFGPGRGGGGATTSPARSGANTPANTGGRGGTGAGRGGAMGGQKSAMPGGRGNGAGPRGGGRSGYADDDEDEDYTRETWLKEDDVDWSRNQTRPEELDDR